MNNPDPETIVREAKTIAVVGLSNDPQKPSNEVGSYLKEQGYRVIPVNPKEEEVLGERSYETVEQIPEEVDVVDVFLRPEKTPEAAEDAVRAGAKTLWLQEGIESEEARRIAEENGLAYVENRCMRKTHEGLRDG
ncbi:MAG TPA: CoA-binding protein [Rubrobacteraceae bacterium]|jgi:predicted CoA-binding protein|nr:CoA-binding protein [Rubrobacteraceae bacterium]